MGLICSTTICPSTLGVWTTYVSNRLLTVAILGQTLSHSCSWRAAALSHRLHSPLPKPQPGHLIPQLDGRVVKNHWRLRDNPHFFFIFLFFDSRLGSCQRICSIIIANKSFSSAKAALVCSFRASGKNRRHLGCRNIVCSRGSAAQNKGITWSQNLSSKLLREWVLYRPSRINGHKHFQNPRLLP